MTWGIIVWIYPSVSSCFVDSRDVFRNDGLSPYRLYLPLSTCRRNIDILSVCPSNHLLMSSIEPFSKSGGSRSCTSTVGNDRINLRSSSVGEGFEGMPCSKNGSEGVSSADSSCLASTGMCTNRGSGERDDPGVGRWATGADCLAGSTLDVASSCSALHASTQVRTSSSSNCSLLAHILIKVSLARGFSEMSTSSLDTTPVCFLKEGYKMSSLVVCLVGWCTSSCRPPLPARPLRTRREYRRRLSLSRV